MTTTTTAAAAAAAAEKQNIVSTFLQLVITSTKFESDIAKLIASHFYFLQIENHPEIQAIGHFDAPPTELKAYIDSSHIDIQFTTPQNFKSQTPSDECSELGQIRRDGRRGIPLQDIMTNLKQIKSLIPSYGRLCDFTREV